jgi:hypothetical protein
MTQQAEDKATGNFIFRVENKLREEFFAACKQNDQTASQVLRIYMRDYIAKSQKKKTV